LALGSGLFRRAGSAGLTGAVLFLSRRACTQSMSPAPTDGIERDFGVADSLPVDTLMRENFIEPIVRCSIVDGSTGFPDPGRQPFVGLGCTRGIIDDRFPFRV
jgi:hypothetical protein